MTIQRIETLAAKPPKDTIQSVAEWLAAYMEQSWQIANKYRKLDFVLALLKPVLKKVPCKPLNEKLYRILSANKPVTMGQDFVLPASQAFSFTFGKGKKFWGDLGDQIGVVDQDNACVVEVLTPVVEIFNVFWAVGPFLSYAKQYAKKADREAIYESVSYLDNQRGFKWQKEVVAYSKSPIKCKVVHLFDTGGSDDD